MIIRARPASDHEARTSDRNQRRLNALQSANRALVGRSVNTRSPWPSVLATTPTGCFERATRVTLGCERRLELDKLSRHDAVDDAVSRSVCSRVDQPSRRHRGGSSHTMAAGGVGADTIGARHSTRRVVGHEVVAEPRSSVLRARPLLSGPSRDNLFASAASEVLEACVDHDTTSNAGVAPPAADGRKAAHLRTRPTVTWLSRCGRHPRPGNMD